MYYDVFEDDTIKAFEDFYIKNPHLYKKHEKKYNHEYDSPYTYEANNFIPDDIDEWTLSIGNLFQYERDGYVKIDREEHLIILSQYVIQNPNVPYLRSRAIWDTNTNLGYYFTVKSIGTSPYALLHCNGKYQMGGWTDYDQFYKQRQRKLDAKSYDILMSIDKLKHLPLNQLKYINAYKLLDTDDVAWLYQIEILLKLNLVGLATDIHIERQTISKAHFKKFKKEIMDGIRLEELKILINEFELSQREIVEKIERKKLMQLYAKMPKSVFDIGDYIIKHPESAKELEHEGNILHHCVSSYLPKIVRGNTEILLLRKKSAPDDPYFTIEINNNRVMQVRTERNQTDDSITHLVEQWQENRGQA